MQTDANPSLNPQTAGGPGRPGPLSSAALVFFGGACYGFNATCFKIAFNMGFSSAQIAAAQVWASFTLFGLLFAVGLLRGRRWVRLGRATAAKLFLAGLLVGMLVLAEPVGPVEWLGVAIILVGVCVSQLQFLRKR